ncbi:MAG: arylesterase [Acidobacteriaceae bacterium]
MAILKLNWLRSSLPIIVLGVLAGCNGSRPAKRPATTPQPAPASTSVPAAQKDTRPVIVAFGDSLTAGYGTDAGQSYPDYLQHELDARGYRYRVVNEGISGNTSKDGVVRLPGIVALHPMVAIVSFGGNDGLRGIPILDSQMNLETIISALQDAHAKVILGGIALPPNYGKDYIQRFNQMYRNQARDYHVPLLPFMLKGVYGVPGSMQNDGIHATAKGNRQVAKNFLPLLLPILKKTEAPQRHRRPHGAVQ